MFSLIITIISLFLVTALAVAALQNVRTSAKFSERWPSVRETNAQMRRAC